MENRNSTASAESWKNMYVSIGASWEEDVRVGSVFWKQTLLCHTLQVLAVLVQNV